MDKVQIIVIDSGVSINHPDFSNDVIHGMIWRDGEMVEGITDQFGHGTAIYGIIRKVNAFCNITNIKIDNIEYGILYDSLVELLEYIDSNMDADIINLSLGVECCESTGALYEVCQRLHDKGTVILSAFSNEGCISYPAAFDNVIGVCSDLGCWKNNVFYYIQDNVLNLCGKGGRQRLCWTPPTNYIVSQGNSFACAHATVQTAKFIYAHQLRGRDEVLKSFELCAQYKHYPNNNHNWLEERKPTKIKNAALFPFTKEMHSLIRYHDLLDFDIAAVYDIKYSGNIGLSTRKCIKDEKAIDKNIKNIQNVDWNEFDTIILGHLDELTSLTSANDLRRDLIDQAISKGKQIYSFDDLSKYGYEKCSNVYYPYVDMKDVPPNRLGMLYRLSKPIVGVFGTSSQQGKFTLQLKMREIFIKRGYKLGQIGTEPSAHLFGFDYCYPMGYNSSVYIHEFEAVRYLNCIINQLSNDPDCELIIAGSQSGTIPYSTANILHFPLQQQIFLTGIQPDCVILCINPFDEVDYVKRTINYIESCVETKVICLVLFPMDITKDLRGMLGSKSIIEEEKYKTIKEMYESEFQIPLFLLGVEHEMEKVVDIVIDTFSEEHT